MSHILSNIGEEWYAETALEGASITITLYNDSNDNFGETEDLSNITTPSGSNFSPQPGTTTITKVNGDWGFTNSGDLSFDTSDSTMTVDSAAILATFDSDEAGDGGTSTQHVVATAALSDTRQLSEIENFEVPAGTLGVNVD